MPLSAFQCAAIYLLLLLPCKVMMCLTLLWTYMVDSVYRNLHFLLLFHCCNNSKSVKSWDWSRNARSVWELCNERTKNGNLWPKTDLPPIVLIALVFFCSESTEGGGEWILGQWLVVSVPCSSFLLFSICALLCWDWEVLCLLTSLFSAWWVVLMIKPYHWYQPDIPCPIISIADEPIVFPQLVILLPTCLSSYPRPTTCKAKVNGKWMVVQVASHFSKTLGLISFSQSLDDIIWL